jgi:hypothetical protein
MPQDYYNTVWTKNNLTWLRNKCFNETINCQRHLQIILGQFFPELIQEEWLYGWFVQDSANTHTARISMQVLSDVFGDRINSTVFGLQVHPVSFLVTFLFRGCLKDEVTPSGRTKRNKLFVGELQVFLQSSFKG